MSKLMKKDNRLMSLLSVWGIILVVLGHSGFEEPIIQQKLKFLHDWIYSFHMPLFFMISGYLFSHTNDSLTDINPQKFIRKKTLRLLVPYVVLGIILYGIKYCFAGFSHASRDFSVSNFFLMFISPGNENSTMGYLWYLFTLYIIFLLVLSLSMIKIDLKNPICALLTLAVAVIFIYCFPKIRLFNLSSVMQYLPYFLIGILYKQYEFKLQFLITPSANMAINNCDTYNYKISGTIKLLVYIVLSLSFSIADLPGGGYCQHGKSNNRNTDEHSVMFIAIG